jgi:hypothetical protein
MSATELLKEAKALPEAEREKLLLGLLRLEKRQTLKSGKRQKVRWPDIQARAQRIFGRKVFPNLVLLERDEQAF